MKTTRNLLLGSLCLLTVFVPSVSAATYTIDADHSAATFKSAKVTDAAAESAKLHGDLTIHGVTKPVVLDLAIHGVGDDPWGNTRSGFTATTTIDRKEFGITWNQPVVGGLMLGDEVEITLEVEGLLNK